MAKTLDEEYPQGNPLALNCRHCQRAKQPLGYALICANCDSRNGNPITRSLLS